MSAAVQSTHRTSAAEPTLVRSGALTEARRASVAPATLLEPIGEAARYGVLRRLGPALKHDMVVNLQAVAMMSEVLGAKLERGVPTQAELQSSVARINRLAREAVGNCLRVAGWVDPAQDEGIDLRDGVEDCLSLLRSSLNFRGFTLRTDLPMMEFQVSKVLLRNLLVASLMSLTDRAVSAGEVVVQASVSGTSAILRLSFNADADAARDEAVPFEPSYRRLDWADVQALAANEPVELRREDGLISFRLARLVATTPLQIAPL